MSLQAVPPRTSMVQQLARALEGAGDNENAASRSRAFMLAEAIDEADEADALFRFGPRLRTCLAPLGLDLTRRAGVTLLVPQGSGVAA